MKPNPSATSSSSANSSSIKEETQITVIEDTIKNESDPSADELAMDLEALILDPVTQEPVHLQKKDEEVLDELRNILVAPEKSEIQDLRGEIYSLQELLEAETLFDRVSPLLMESIERRVRDSPKEMTELLYPLLGGMVKRSVEEAMKNLADRIDAGRRASFSFDRLLPFRRRNRTEYVEGEDELRDLLPFEVEELFIIHRESGLLLHHQSSKPEMAHDSDIISAMLTAIRDFANDAFGAEDETSLNEIQFGSKLIILEGFEHCYAAVVADGIEPYGYRDLMRNKMYQFEKRNRKVLATYYGDQSTLKIYADAMTELMDVKAIEAATSSS